MTTRITTTLAETSATGRTLAAAASRDRAKGGMARLSPALKAVALGAQALDALAPTLSTRIMLRHFTRPRLRHGADYRQLLPAGARRLTLAHRGQELTGWCWGEQGPAALLVHGWEDHSGSMLAFVEPLRALGFRVFTLDAPGHGLSPAIATNLLDCSYALERMCAAYGPFDHVVAHSFGATAMCVGLARGELSRPQRMALISPMRDMEQHLQVFADIALLSRRRTERLRGLVTETLGCPPQQLCAFAALADMPVAGLVLHDQHDPLIPHAVGESLAARWSGARFVSTQNLGHRRILRCPRVLDEVTGFLGCSGDSRQVAFAAATA